MNSILAAAFGVAANRIEGAIIELFDAYDRLEKAGIQMTAEDKIEYERELRRIRQLVENLRWAEVEQMINRVLTEQEQAKPQPPKRRGRPPKTDK